MRDWLLNLIPDELLNLIWRHVKPSIKYKLSHKYFSKYYYIRFAYINNKNLQYLKSITIYNSYNIVNYNYIKYLIMNDCEIMIKNIIKNKMNFDKSNYVFKKPILFKNYKFNNFIEFCYCYGKWHNSYKIINYLNFLIKEYKLEDLVKKWHKNKDKSKSNKAIIWKA